MLLCSVLGFTWKVWDFSVLSVLSTDIIVPFERKVWSIDEVLYVGRNQPSHYNYAKVKKLKQQKDNLEEDKQQLETELSEAIDQVLLRLFTLEKCRCFKF